MNYSVGWFGIPGDRSGTHSTLTHVVVDNSHPICLTNIGGDKVYQWCAHPEMMQPECKKCLRIWERNAK